MSTVRIYFLGFDDKKVYVENNFNSLKNGNWKEVGIDGKKSYKINLLNGKIDISGEWIDLGKDINGYYEKFTNRVLEYGKNLIYYCESVPIGMGSNGLRAKNIYLGYECDLEKLKINYGLYTVEKYSLMLVYNCETEKIGFSFGTDVNFNINGKKITVKI